MRRAAAARGILMNSNIPATAACNASASLVANPSIEQKAGIRAHWTWECWRNGELLWTAEYDNLVVTLGLNALLDNTFNAAAGSVAWYVGLKSAGSVAAGDTMSSHAGWTEVEVYDEATRVTWTKNGAASAGAMSNSSSKATFTINDTVTVAGGFLTSNNTKGGTTGTLFGAGDFSPSRDVVAADVLNVTVSLSAAAA